MTETLWRHIPKGTVSRRDAWTMGWTVLQSDSFMAPVEGVLSVDPLLFENALHVMFGRGSNEAVADIMAALRAAVR